MDGFDEYGFDEDFDPEMDDVEGEFDDAATAYGFVPYDDYFDWRDNEDPYVYDDDGNVIGYGDGDREMFSDFGI